MLNANRSQYSQLKNTFFCFASLSSIALTFFSILIAFYIRRQYYNVECIIVDYSIKEMQRVDTLDWCPICKVAIRYFLKVKMIRFNMNLKEGTRRPKSTQLLDHVPIHEKMQKLRLNWNVRYTSSEVQLLIK
jgi:hypothetical protein